MSHLSCQLLHSNFKNFYPFVSHKKGKVEIESQALPKTSLKKQGSLLFSVTLILMKEFDQPSCAALGLCRVGNSWLYRFCTTDV